MLLLEAADGVGDGGAVGEGEAVRHVGAGEHAEEGEALAHERDAHALVAERERAGGEDDREVGGGGGPRAGERGAELAVAGVRGAQPVESGGEVA